MRVLKLEELDQVSGGTFFFCRPKKISFKWGCFSKKGRKSGSGDNCKPRRSCDWGKKTGCDTTPEPDPV